MQKSVERTSCNVVQRNRYGVMTEKLFLKTLFWAFFRRDQRGLPKKPPKVSHFWICSNLRSALKNFGRLPIIMLSFFGQNGKKWLFSVVQKQVMISLFNQVISQQRMGGGIMWSKITKLAALQLAIQNGNSAIHFRQNLLTTYADKQHTENYTLNLIAQQHHHNCGRQTHIQKYFYSLSHQNQKPAT